MSHNNQHNDPWPEEDVAYLKCVYPMQGKEFCALRLGRSIDSVRWKADELGLRQDRSSEFFRDWQARAAESKGGSLWTEQQLKFLREHYAEFGKRGVAKALHKTPRSVQVKAARLGLVQSADCSFANRSAAMRLTGLAQGQQRSDNMTRLQAAGLLRNQYSRGSQGRRPDLGGAYFRSSWEANYARYLNWLKSQGQIDRWEYEADTFWFEAIRRGTRSYKPDFKIWEAGHIVPYYVEIKGWMDPKSETKLRRMKKYHPNVEVRLIDAKQYRSIAETARSLPHWETSRRKALGLPEPVFEDEEAELAEKPF